MRAGLDAALARDWLRLPNPNGRPSSDVLKPWANGFELSRVRNTSGSSTLATR